MRHGTDVFKFMTACINYVRAYAMSMIMSRVCDMYWRNIIPHVLVVYLVYMLRAAA